MKSGVIFFGIIAIVESMSTVEMLRTLMVTRPEGKTDFSSDTTDGSKIKPSLNVAQNAPYFKFSTSFTFRATFRPALNIVPSVV